jgi:hypoxanthine phosphoribosyltransferase
MVYNPIVIGNNHKYSLDSFTVPRHYGEFLDSIIIPKGMIKDRIEKLARDIHRDYIGKSLMLVCVLKGGEKFFSDISHYLDILNSNDKENSVPFKNDYLKAKSYQNDKSSGDVTLTMSDFESLKGKEILLVEDIVDSGETMTKIIAELKKHHPLSIRVASLLVKDTKRSNGYKPDYAGFIIPDLFVVGYCLDYNENFRDLSHICIINDKGKEKYKI